MIDQFFKDIEIPGTVTQMGEVNNIMCTDNFLECVEANKNKDLFFCANVCNPMRSRKKNGDQKFANIHRSSDIDIQHKKYFYLDFDIRKDVEANGLTITDDEIKKLGKDFGEMLNEKRWYRNWSYIVFTGNGVHIYYIEQDPTEINIENYGVGYELMADRIHTLLGYAPDGACKNPARIARVPGSYNNKKEAKHVEIIAHQKERSALIPLLQDRGKAEIKRREEIIQFENDLREIRKRECLYSTDEMIEKINRIPIQNEVLKDHPEWTCNGKNFFKSDGEIATSSFIGDGKAPNTLIIKQSRWFACIHYKGVGTYLYRREMNNMTNPECVEYFKNNYSLT